MLLKEYNWKFFSPCRIECETCSQCYVTECCKKKSVLGNFNQRAELSARVIDRDIYQCLDLF